LLQFFGAGLGGTLAGVPITVSQVVLQGQLAAAAVDGDTAIERKFPIDGTVTAQRKVYANVLELLMTNTFLRDEIKLHLPGHTTTKNELPVNKDTVHRCGKPVHPIGTGFTIPYCSQSTSKKMQKPVNNYYYRLLALMDLNIAEREGNELGPSPDLFSMIWLA
jgi:hypothetical protein